MSDKFQNKYRIPSARHQNWDYRWSSAYFITICTKGRKYYFGDFENGIMKLSNVEVLADVFWHEIKNHSDNVKFGEFVVMPNHIHGIIILNNKKELYSVPNDDSINEIENSINKTELTIGQKRFQNQGKNSVSSIIGGYKSVVTKHANRLGIEFGWQVRFHDHIIRDEKSFENISKYIINNPKNWGDDKFFGTE